MTTNEEILDLPCECGYSYVYFMKAHNKDCLLQKMKLAREDVLKAHEDHDFCKRENCAACYLLDEKEKEIQALKEALEVSVADYNSMKKQKEKAEAELNTVRNVAIKQLILDKKNLENALREISKWPCSRCDGWQIAKKALQEKA